jgi:hypothetical protein
MTRTAGALRRLLWAFCVCALLAPHAARAAEPSVLADFDGDGQRDHAILDRLEPSILRVWLSTTRSTAIVRSQMPIAGIAARDLDGDRRAELIAGGVSTGLQVWTKQHKVFVPFQRRPVMPGTLDRPLRHNIDTQDGDSAVAITSAAPSLIALSLSPQPRAPALVLARLRFPPAVDPQSSQRLGPLAPRPPPVSR